VFEKNSIRENTLLSWRYRFKKAPFTNVLRPHKNESRRFQILAVWPTFSKSSVFVTDYVDPGKSAANSTFSNFSGLSLDAALDMSLTAVVIDKT